MARAALHQALKAAGRVPPSCFPPKKLLSSPFRLTQGDAFATQRTEELDRYMRALIEGGGHWWSEERVLLSFFGLNSE
jgi:hypothetical protein